MESLYNFFGAVSEFYTRITAGGCPDEQWDLIPDEDLKIGNMDPNSLFMHNFFRISEADGLGPPANRTGGEAAPIGAGDDWMYIFNLCVYPLLVVHSAAKRVSPVMPPHPVHAVLGPSAHEMYWKMDVAHNKFVTLHVYAQLEPDMFIKAFSVIQSTNQGRHLGVTGDRCTSPDGQGLLTLEQVYVKHGLPSPSSQTPMGLGLRPPAMEVMGAPAASGTETRKTIDSIDNRI